ncbi:hypothetical protein [Herbaspirillum sp. NPDC101397]|uniref:hypothetical protein n=1 Tax=Herbaspirillum sp. NPDC101397 TaxID=3364006 RepID=UPI00383A1144
MQFIFLIWPILLLPVFVTWLTRPRPVAPPSRSSTQRRAAANSAAAPSPVLLKPVRQTTAAERCCNSPAYRRAAVQAYETIQALDMEEENDDAISSAVQLQRKDAASSRS